MNGPAVLRALLLAVVALGVVPAWAAPMDRQLRIVITLDGAQDWRNELQWYKASTQQRYELTTTLRSDGKLEGANLLDPDTTRRLAIKTEYLRRKGVAMLKANGFDPASPTLMSDLSSRAQKDNFNCKGDTVCLSQTGARYAALMAAAVEPDNSGIFAGEPRYLFFSDFPGCPNQLRAVNRIQAQGETAYGRKKDKLHPFSLDMKGDFAGSEQDRNALCTYFVAVVDTQEQKLYVENVYIPSARGTVTRTEFGKTETREADIPVAEPLQGWVNQTLRMNALSGSAKAVLPLTQPLDGNATILGNFTGEGRATLEWSWTPAPAAARK